MPNAHFFGGHMVLIDEDIGSLMTLRSAFSERGIDQIHSADTLDVLEDVAPQQLLDLVVADADKDPARLCTLMKDLRGGPASLNPYAVMIAITADSSEKRIAALINAGVDAVVIRSGMPQGLFNRVNQFVTTRKGFVATPTYIGPDRRMETRGSVHAQMLLSVPNTLRERAAGTYDAERLTFEISRATAQINQRRRTQTAAMIQSVVSELMPKLQNGTADHKLMVHLTLLRRIAQDLSNRLTEDQIERVKPLCTALLSVLERLIRNPLQPEDKDIQVLKDIAGGIHRTVKGSEKADLSREIADQIQKSKRFGVV